MKVNVEDISSTQKKLEVIIPADDIAERRTTMFNQVKGTANIKGFRPGKAPKHLIESMYGESINEEIVSKIVQETFENAVVEASVTPISRPDITPGKVSAKEDFKYEAIFEVIPEFEVSSYDGLELQKEVYTIEQKQIDETLERLQENQAKSEEIKEEREVKKGDYAFIDYKGTIEGGETIDDLNRENVRFEIGKDQLIPEFEENILGMKKGDTTNFKVTYPEEFTISEAAGKTVDFSLKVNEIHEKILPEINDQFAKDLGLEGIDDLRNKIEEDLVNQYENRSNTNLREQILENLVKNNDFEVPNSLVMNEQARLKQEFISSFQQQGMQMPEIGPEAEKKFAEKATESVKGSIILNKISEIEGIEATTEDVDHRIKHIAESYQVPFETVKESYVKNNMIDNIESAIVEKKVLDFIIEKAKITEVEPEEDSVDNENNS